MEITPFDVELQVQRLFDVSSRTITVDPYDVNMDIVLYNFPLESEVRYGVVFGKDGDLKVGTFIGFDQDDITYGRRVTRLGPRVALLE